MTLTKEQYQPQYERQFGDSAHGDLTSNVSYVAGMSGSQTIDDVLRLLRQGNGEITDKILKDLIVDHSPRREAMIKLYQRYVGDPAGVPIKNRKLANPHKVNNKLANDYFGDIVDTKVGYFGTGIRVDLNTDSYKDDAGELEEERFQEDQAVIQDYRDFTNADDVEADITRNQAICGLGVKLLYVREGDAKPRQRSMDPWEFVFIFDESIQEPQYVMRYYKVIIRTGDDARERWRVEWYDKQSITFLLEDENGHFVPDEGTPAAPNPKAHLFGDIPVIAIPNNKQMMGDAEKVLDLIDAIDRTDSDVNSEIEQLRLAYMYLKGAGLNLDDQFVETMKQTGVIPLPENGDVGFATKTLDDAVIMNHLKRLERNIMRFAKSVDYGDEAFGGQLPVIAYQIKMAGLEQKSKTTEMKYRAALRYEYTLLAEMWRQMGTADIDPLDIKFTFTRNLPPNLEGEMNVLRLGSGLVSQKTLFSLMSFIKDPEEEIRRLEEEKGEPVDLDSAQMEEAMNAEGTERPGEASPEGNTGEGAGPDRAGPAT